MSKNMEKISLPFKDKRCESLLKLLKDCGFGWYMLIMLTLIAAIVCSAVSPRVDLYKERCNILSYDHKNCSLVQKCIGQSSCTITDHIFLKEYYTVSINERTQSAYYDCGDVYGCETFKCGETYDCSMSRCNVNLDKDAYCVLDNNIYKIYQNRFESYSIYAFICWGIALVMSIACYLVYKIL